MDQYGWLPIYYSYLNFYYPNSSMPMLLKTHHSFSLTFWCPIPMSQTLLELFLSLGSVRQRFNYSKIPSFVTHSETWKEVRMISQVPKNYHKILPFFGCVNAHCMCIFHHLFLLIPSPNGTNSYSSTSYECLLSTL